MIKFRYKNEEEREFSRVGKVVSKISDSVVNTGKVFKRTGKKISNNPGHFVRKQAAATVQNPAMSAAVAGDIGLSAAYINMGHPELALPIVPGLKSAMLVPAISKATGKALPAQATRTKIAREMMENRKDSVASKVGQNIEHSINKAVINAGSPVDQIGSRPHKIFKNKKLNELLDSASGIEPEATFKNSGPNSEFKDRAWYNIRSAISDASKGVKAAGKTVLRTISASDTEGEAQKNYTIQEGHYTGPKDMEKVPGVIEVLGKATIGGSAVGALSGGILKETGAIENTGILDGAKKGGKIGFFTGIALKALLNHLHKPMSKVKYQEVDRTLRREFGMYRIAGLTVGDTREKRKTYDEKFGTNDRDVLKYPINICINNNQVTMYTLGLSDDLLERLNKSLDYYCKKYSGMEYSSRVINSKTNTYSVNITFTNYEAISSFIMEISEVLGVRINLLNNDVLPETKIGKSEVHSEEKIFSNIPSFSKYDISQIFLKSGAKSISALAMGGPVAGFAALVHQTLTHTLDRMARKEVVRLVGGSRKDYDNDFLLNELKRLGYLEGPHYTKGIDKCNLNLSMVCGKVILTSKTGSKEDLMMPKILGNQEYKKTDINGKANLWTFLITSKGSFDVFLKTLIGSVKPNIYD